jgi:hypothetical protein
VKGYSVGSLRKGILSGLYTSLVGSVTMTGVEMGSDGREEESRESYIAKKQLGYQTHQAPFVVLV